METQTKKGFSLIEILVAVTIISLISTTAFISYEQFQKKSRDAKRKSDLLELKVALEMYKTNNGSYPLTPPDTWYSSESGDNVSDNGGNYITGLIPNYIAQLPRDPKGGNSSYCTTPVWKRAYIYRSDGKDYKLLSHCAPEASNWLTTDPFWDPAHQTWAWQVSSSPTSRNW